MAQIEQIKAEIEGLYKEYRLSTSTEAKYRCEAYKELLDFIDSLQKEPMSEDLEKYEKEYFEKWKDDIISVYDRHAGLVDGAQWQKERMMKALLDMEKDSVEVERKYGEGGRELYLKMLGILRPFEED